MLPEEGEEARAGAEAVVGIAGEVAAEHFFFVKKTEDDQGDNGEEREGPPGAQRKGRKKQNEKSDEVHGIADKPVGTGGEDFVRSFELQVARGETVRLYAPTVDQ